MKTFFTFFFISVVVASCGNKYYGSNFISAVPTSLLIAPGLRTIQFLFSFFFCLFFIFLFFLSFQNYLNNIEFVNLCLLFQLFPIFPLYHSILWQLVSFFHVPTVPFHYPAKHCGGTAEAQRRHSSLRCASAVPPKREQTTCWNQIFLVEMQKTEAGPGLKSINF